MPHFKKKINYSTHDSSASLLLYAANTRSSPKIKVDSNNNRICCENNYNYKKNINTLDKNTLIKNHQMGSQSCYDGKIKCCIKNN